mmetsp:Transcript_124409/g.215625  ORF Transcript_124409/g.215625 Transcript_124409/m.215625 type:complete len:304 (+) Transcript_124409:101-1012(+)
MRSIRCRRPLPRMRRSCGRSSGRLLTSRTTSLRWRLSSCRLKRSGRHCSPCRPLHLTMLPQSEGPDPSRGPSSRSWRPTERAQGPRGPSVWRHQASPVVRALHRVLSRTPLRPLPGMAMGTLNMWCRMCSDNPSSHNSRLCLLSTNTPATNSSTTSPSPNPSSSTPSLSSASCRSSSTCSLRGSPSWCTSSSTAHTTLRTHDSSIYILSMRTPPPFLSPSHSPSCRPSLNSNIRHDSSSNSSSSSSSEFVPWLRRRSSSLSSCRPHLHPTRPPSRRSPGPISPRPCQSMKMLSGSRAVVPLSG